MHGPVNIKLGQHFNRDTYSREGKSGYFQNTMDMLLLLFEPRMQRSEWGNCVEMKLTRVIEW
jgi:hypothetical protein